MGGAKQAGKDPSVLSAVLLQSPRRGEETFILVKRLSDSEESTSRLSVPPKCQNFQNVSRGTMSWNILQASLVPSQVYQVKVRSLVVPKDRAIYGGIPSELSLPATWTSHEGSLTPQICRMTANITFLLPYCVYSDQHHFLCAVFPRQPPGRPTP